MFQVLLDQYLTQPHSQLFGRLVVGALLLAAAWGKLRNLPALRKTLAGQFDVPRPAAKALAPLLPAVEGVVAALLMAGVMPRAAGWISLALLMVFTLALVRARLKGRHVLGCHCFGSSDQFERTSLLIVRNLLLIAAVLPVALHGGGFLMVWPDVAASASPPPLSDAFAVAAAVAGLLALFSLLRQLSRVLRSTRVLDAVSRQSALASPAPARQP
jgi:uncharacterized membrane protein YphA (DoxX/SURF4 family)